MRKSLENIHLSPTDVALGVNENVSVIQGESRPTNSYLVRITVLEEKWMAIEFYVVWRILR